MAAKKTETFNDELTIVAEPEKEKYSGPTVRIYLQPLEDPGDAGIKVDQYEHVTIANEEKEERFYVRRGEWVDIPVSVFMVMKERYPNL